LGSCANQETPVQPIQKQSKNNKESNFFYDSISSSQPKKASSYQASISSSPSWLKNPLFYKQYSKRIEKKIFYPSRVEKIRFPIDSIAKMHDDYKAPIIKKSNVIRTTVIEPKKTKVSLPRFRDNSTQDIKSIGINEGFPSKQVNAIHIDKKGFTWVTTPSGLLRYDGEYVKQFTEENGLPENNLTCIAEDDQGNIWLGTSTNGIVQYNGETFAHYKFDSLTPNREISNITFDRDNNVWCSIIFGGILKIEGDKYKFFNKRQGVIDYRPITQIAVDSNNVVFASGFGTGIYRINNDTLDYINRKISNWNHDFLLKEDGSLFITPYADFFHELKDDSLYTYHFDFTTTAGYKLPTLDEKGNIWFALIAEGLVKWDGEKIEVIDITDGLPSNNISAIHMHKNELWLGTSDQGLVKYNPYSFHFLTEKDQLPHSIVNKVVQDHDNNYYFATSKGVSIHNDSMVKYFNDGIHYSADAANIKNYYSEEFSMNGFVNDVFIDSSGLILMAVSNKGLLYLNQNNQSIAILGSNISKGPANSTSITRTKNGKFWIGSHSGGHFYKIEKDSMKWYGRKDNLFTTKITDLLTNYNNEVCIATEDYGLIIMRDESTFVYHNREDGLPSPEIHSIYEDSDNTLWACTSEGLAYKKKNSESFKSLSLPDYIPSNNIKAIIRDTQNTVPASRQRYWITTQKGLLMLVLDENFQTIQHDYFDETEGLINSTFIDKSIYIDHKNQLMAGTEGGLMVLDLQNYVFQKTTPDVFIENIMINGDFINFRNNEQFKFEHVTPFFNLPQALQLDHTQNHITFNFSRKVNNDFQPYNIEYRLENFDQSWNSNTDALFAEYKNLDFGDYTLKYRTVLPNGTTSEIKSFSFKINRPWWHTWWARGLIILLILIFILLIIRWRTSALQKRQRELKIEVSKATKEIREQKETIELVHNEIKDSIVYARRIQSAILPPEKVVRGHIENSFVWYLPKDVVAGDFYWMQSKDDMLLIAAADCTGHGVPGALVSVVCNNSLNRAVREFGLRRPSAILDKTRELVIEEFEKSEEDVKDGMDISLIAFRQEDIVQLNDKTSSINNYNIQWGGANNPLWIVRKDPKQLEPNSTLRNDDYALIEIKPDKQPIGKHEIMKPFTNQEIELLPGDTVYMFTDGFADQFGGKTPEQRLSGGKKYKTKNFKYLLLSIQEHPMYEQRKILEDEFNDWKGELNQVDDVCVIGVRL
jgi:ligand-binding sensor domain-containing protein